MDLGKERLRFRRDNLFTKTYLRSDEFLVHVSLSSTVIPNSLE